MAYTKNNWQTGDVITKEKLNHMEDGIANSFNVIESVLTVKENTDNSREYTITNARAIADALSSKAFNTIVVLTESLEGGSSSHQFVLYPTILTDGGEHYMAFYEPMKQNEKYFWTTTEDNEYAFYDQELDWPGSFSDSDIDNDGTARFTLS